MGLTMHGLSVSSEQHLTEHDAGSAFPHTSGHQPGMPCGSVTLCLACDWGAGHKEGAAEAEGVGCP